MICNRLIFFFFFMISCKRLIRQINNYPCCSLHSLYIRVHEGIHGTTLRTNLSQRVINTKPYQVILIFNYPTSYLVVGNKKEKQKVGKRNSNGNMKHIIPKKFRNKIYFKAFNKKNT